MSRHVKIKKCVAGLSVLVSATFAISSVAGSHEFALPSQASDVARDVAGPRVFELPPQASQVAKDIFSLGSVVQDGGVIEGFMFIHRRTGEARPPGVGGGGGGGTTSTCYALMASGARWKTTENYILDSTNSNGMSDAIVAGVIQQATTVWDEQTSRSVFGSRVAGTIDGADTSAPDNKNEVYFAFISDPNVIAVTIVWGRFSGPAALRELVEWDQVYDDTEFVFGDADVNTGVMDMLSIAAHEVGHAAGMNHPADSCTEETMYRYAGAGETKKRDLNAGDIAGIKTLYK
jgi:hypothetical protein